MNSVSSTEKDTRLCPSLPPFPSRNRYIAFGRCGCGCRSDGGGGGVFGGVCCCDCCCGREDVVV